MLECRDPANAGVYEVVQDRVCYRKQALEEVTGAKDWKPEPGQVLTVEEIDESVVTRSVAATLRSADEEQDHTDASPAEGDDR